MNNILFYPAIFHSAEENGFWVTFPDLPECMTQGDYFENAYNMAVDALGLCIAEHLKDNKTLPVPSSPDVIPLDNNAYIVIIKL